MVEYELTNPLLFQKIFGIKDPLTVLENDGLILSCLTHLTYQMNRIEKYDSSYKLKADLIENYILYIASKKKRSIREENIIKMYRNKYPKIINNYNLDAIVASKIFKYYDCLLTSEELTKCSDRIIALTEKATNIFDKFVSKKMPINRDLNYLFEFLTNNVDSENEYIINVCESFTKLMLKNKDNLNNNIYFKNFILHYLMHKFCKQNIYADAPLYICNTFPLDNKPYDALGRTYFPYKIITLSYNFVNQDFNDTIGYYNISRDIKTIMVLFHELQHLRQNNEFKDDVFLNNTTFSMIKTKILNEYLSKNGQSEYLINYKYREIEREADVFGWVQSFSTLAEYAPERTNEIKEIKNHAVKTYYEQSVAYQTDTENGKLAEIDLYNVTKLTEIIQKNPNLISRYPSLKLFFNIDGSRKNLKDLVITYHDTENNKHLFENYEVDMNVFNEFFKIIIAQNGINRFPLSLPEKYQITWFTIIFNLFIKESENIKQMLTISNIIDKNIIKHFCESRSKYLTMFQDYLEQNYSAILHLKNYTEFHKEEFDALNIEEINKIYETALNNISMLLKDKVKMKTL